MRNRLFFEHQINEVFDIHAVCALLGPRQCGKTTLARQFAQKSAEKFSKHIHFFDLENPNHLNALQSPLLTLEPLEGLIIIDEIQRIPELFPCLRVLVDNSSKKFLILGSASRDLIRQSSETLAGRISFLELTPFSLSEIETPSVHWMRGGFPKSYLAKADAGSERWRADYITTYLERDLMGMGFDINAALMRRLWMMLAHYHAQTLNLTEIGRSLQLSDSTIRRYIEILSGSFMVRLLKPWFENLSKRQVKSPKIYVRDSGILHALLGITLKNWIGHPKSGSSWEGYALEETLRFLKANADDCYFWRTERGAELDLLVLQDGKRLGFEFKYTDAPQLTRSMHVAFEDLKLDSLTVITPGKESYPLSATIQTCGLEKFIRPSPHSVHF